MKKYFLITLVVVFVLFGLIRVSKALAIVIPPSQGPNNTSTVTDDSSIGSFSWSHPDRAKISNDSWATTTLSISSLRTHYLKATGFGFTIPNGATINGIQIGIERHQACASRSCTSVVTDNTVKIVKNGTIVGNNYASPSGWPTSDTIINYGTGTDDKWGTTWTASDINNINTGVVLSVERNSGKDRDLFVDNITMTVYYTLATSITTITPPLTDIPYGTAFSIETSVSPSDTTGNIDIKEGLTVLSSATITGGAGTANISASYSADNLPVGSHSIVGVYGGDAGHSGSTSTPPSTINIVQAPTSIEITNGAELETPSYTKHSYTVKWNVIPSLLDGVGTPTGTVTISGGSDCTANVSDGQCDITSTEIGDKTLVATYSGDSNFLGSVSTGTPHNVLEDTPPVIDSHEDISGVEATTPSGAVIIFTVNSTDVPDGILPAVCSPASGSTFALGETTVTCNKTDSVGNEAEPISFKVTVIDTTGPEIILNGNNPFDIYINNDYSTLNPSPDYTSIDAYDGVVTPIVTGQDFDNTVLGSHTITYSATDSHSNNTTITRTVNVVDKNKPIIYRIGGSPLTVEGGSTYTDLGATAVDRDGSNITSSIITVNPVNTGTVGTYTVTYDVIGAELGSLTGTNIADQAKRIVNVVDNTTPVITVDGATVELLVGAPYDIKTGVTARDNVDGDLTSSIVVGGDYSGTGTAGTYTATYDVVDLAGHPAIQMSRTIHVNEPDTIDPTIISIKATAHNTIEVLFDEALQNNTEGHHPSNSDFIVYNDVNKSGDYNEEDNSYGIENVNYENNKITIILTNPLKSGDIPRLKIMPEITSLVDISSNYFNNGNSYDTSITDKINPIITLNGSNPVNITQGATYIDAGATVIDAFDNAVTVIPNSNVNTNIIGTYTVTYNATDKAGNEANQISRTVNVIASSSGSSGSISSSGGYVPGYGPNLITSSIKGTGTMNPTITGGQVLGAEKYNFTLLLKRGSRGNEVIELQKLLNSLGFNCGPVDGIFGIRTKLAVVKFQVVNGIPATGVVGSLTRAALNK